MVDDPVLLPDGYQISIPDRQPINLHTGANWERTGVTPDAAGGDDPLFVARQLLARSASRNERTIAIAPYRRRHAACLESKHPGSSRALRVNGLNEDSADRQFRADRARDLRRIGASHEVVGLDRSPFATTRIIADVTDHQAVARAVQGVDAVIHTAALHAPHVGLVPDGVPPDQRGGDRAPAAGRTRSRGAAIRADQYNRAVRPRRGRRWSPLDR